MSIQNTETNKEEGERERERERAESEGIETFRLRIWAAKNSTSKSERKE